jgi:hypothetical protein
MLGALFILDDPIFRGLAISLIFRHHGIHAADADLHSGAVLRGVPAAAGADKHLISKFLGIYLNEVRQRHCLPIHAA